MWFVHLHVLWFSCSNFSEIFDVDWYISYLSKDVKIIKQLPTKGGKVMNPHSMRVPRKCNPRCYETRVLPVLNKKRVSVHFLRAFQLHLKLGSSLDVCIY